RTAISTFRLELRTALEQRVAWSQTDLSSVEFLGDALGGLAGSFPFLLRQRSGDDLLRFVVEPQQRVTVRPTDTLLVQVQDLVDHASVALVVRISAFPSASSPGHGP